MKKKIGIFSLFLVLALVLTLLPGLQTEAEAAAAGSITVNGYTLNSGYYLPTATWTQTKTKPSGSYFYYSSGTLTIYNVTLTCSGNTRAVYAEGDLVVSLSGTSKLTTTNANGIRSTGTLKFTGSGSLTVNSSGYNAIYSSGNMEFAQTGTVTTTATGHSSSGVECAAKLTIGGNLNATSESSYAIFAMGDISMTKGTVNATGNCTYSAGGIRSNGAITVSGGTLNVTSKSDGIIAKNDFWQKAGNVTVDAGWNGIIVENSTNDARINEGTLTVTAVRDGIKARKFYMNGGHGYIKSTNTSSDSSYYAVKLAGNTSTYFYMQGSVKASGSTTTSSSGLTSLTYANLPTYDYVFFTGYIMVSGVELRDGHYLQSGKTTANTSKPSTGGYAYYSGNTLTLNNYERSNTSFHGINSKFDLNIVLAQGSTNKLTTSTTNGTTYRGINVSGTLKISGLGQLTISGGQYAIYSTGSLTIGTSVIKTYGSGIYSGSTISLDGAMLDMTNINSYSAMACAIKTNYNLYIDGGAIGIYAPNKVTLSGTSTSVGVTGIYANYIDSSGSMGLEVSGDGISCASKVYIHGGTLDIVVQRDNTSGIKAKEISISDGTLNLSGKSEGGYSYGLYATDKVTISGGTVNADFEKYAFAVECEKDVVISGGSVNIKSYCGLSADNLRISGGIVDISTDIGSISARMVNFTGGMVTTRNTSSKAYTYSYANVSSDTFVVADHLAAIGSDESSGKGYEVLTINGLKTYHYLAIGEFVMLHDVVLPTGHYLESGNSKNTVSTTVPSSGDYAYYKDGILTLCDYEYSGTSIAVRAFSDLTVYMVGGSKINHIISHDGDLTFNGTGALEIKRNMSSCAVTVPGDVYVKDGMLTVNGSGGNGIDCKHFYLNNGKVWVNANFNGIEIDTGLTVNGGSLVVTSTGTTNDTMYRAINSTATRPTVNIASGLNHMVGTTSAPDYLPDTDFLTDDCDFVALGELVMVRGVILFKGNYLKTGSDSPIQSGAGTSYAYYSSDNRLILKNYSFSGSEVGIASNVDLTVVLEGTNKLDCKIKSVSTGGGYRVQLNNGIAVRGNLTIEGRSTATDSLNITAAGAAIYCDGTLNVKGDNITAASDYTNALYAKNLNVSSGTLTVTNTCTSNHTTYAAIELDGNMTVTGGNVTVTGGKCDGIVLPNGNLSMQGGELTVNALYNAIELTKGRLNMNGGFLTASSTSTDSDSSYCALKLAGSTSSYYNVAVAGEIASTSPTKKSPKKLDPAQLSTYDYVQLGDFVEIIGKTVRSGYSLKNDGTVVSGNAGGGSAYYVSEYAGNTLTLNGFKSTVMDVTGILTTSDLTIKVIGSSSITSEGNGNIGYTNIIAAGNVTFTGTKTQTLTLNSDVGSMDVAGNVVFAGGNVTMDESLIAGGDVTISSGIINANGYHYAISGKNVTVNGGQLFAQSSEAGHAVKSTTFTYSSDLTAAGGFTGRYDQNSQFYNSDRHNDYKFLYVGDCVLVYGVILPTGRYMVSGSKAPVLTTTSTNYVYYSNGTLTMRNYTIRADVHGVNALRPLTINVVGSNSVTTSGRVAAIRAESDLKITGTGSLECTTTVELGLLVNNGNLTIENATVILESSHYGTIEVSDGDLIVNSGSLTCSSDESTIAVVLADNMTVNGGTVTVTAMESTGIKCYDGTVTINGGTVNTTSRLYGVFCADFVMTDGSFKAICQDRENDILYMAVYGKMDISKISSHIKLANTSAYESGRVPYVESEHSSYDYIYFEPLSIKVGDLEIPDGYYLGLNTHTVTTTKPSGGYAYRSDNTLKLVNFVFNGDLPGIVCNSDLKLVLEGSNSLSTGTKDGINVTGTLTVSGTGSLNLTSDAVVITAGSGFTFGTAKLTVTSNHNHAIVVQSGDATINSGELTVSAKFSGIQADKVTFNGGTALIKSMTTGTDDALYSAISADSVTVDKSLRGYAAADYIGTNAQQYKASDLATYDYFKIAKAPTVEYGSLSGTVTGMQNSVDVNLALYQSGEAEPAYKAVRLGNGTFTFSYVAYGTYTLKATASGYEEFSTTVTVSGSSPSVAVTMTKAASSGVTVGGTVTSYLADGTVTIKLYKEGSSTASYTTTVTGIKGEAVTFSIGNVTAGTYTMEVSKANHVTQTYTVTVGSSNVTQDAKICPVGDITGDGKVNMKDWSQLYNHINEISTLSGYSLACADTNGDGKVNMKDWSILYNHISEIKPLW